MRKALNKELVEGRIYQHKLEVKTVSNQASVNFGKPFIAGTIEVAVDEQGLNVIPVHFTYVTETTANGSNNATYSNLKKIIDNGKTWIADGKDEATKVSISTAIALNDFYTQDDSLVSVKTNEGGFVTIVGELKEEKDRNFFQVDMLINGTTRISADPEKNIDKDYVIVKGAIFNFRNDLLPVDFVVRTNDGMEYFENLGADNANPVYTKVWGKIECRTIVTEMKEESAFGESSVRTFERKTKEWVITGTAQVPYDFGDENVLTVEDVNTAIQNRELMLAETKKRSEEYRASKNSISPAPEATVTAAKPVATQVGNFSF